MDASGVEFDRVTECLETGLRALDGGGIRAAVLVPLIPGEDGPDILFEVRAAHLKRQPGEVCLPGGHIEPGESARDAVIREVCEELLVTPAQVRSVTDMGKIDGPGGMPLRVFAGRLDGYAGTFDPQEVGSTFAVPLAWFMEREPAVYRGRHVLRLPGDFPWELVPGGRAYPWHERVHEVPFYQGTDPVIWGFTARVVRLLVDCLKAGGYRADGWERDG